MRQLRIGLLLAAAVGLIAVAGCGGDDDAASDQQYADEIRAVLEPFGTEFQRAGEQIGELDEADYQGLTDRLSSLRALLDETISSIEAIEPPEAAEAGDQALIGALQGLRGPLSEVIDTAGEAADGGEEVAVERAAEDLQQAGQQFATEVGAALEELEEAGIPIAEAAPPEG